MFHLESLQYPQQGLNGSGKNDMLGPGIHLIINDDICLPFYFLFILYYKPAQ
jgi:hypothetical protein